MLGSIAIGCLLLVAKAAALWMLGRLPARACPDC